MIEWLGRFHPLLVHLPIGFLVLLSVLEWLGRHSAGKEFAAATRVILALTVPASVASVACGWLLANDGGYDAQALFWHRWLGTGVAVASGILWVLRQHGWLRAYRRGVWATLVLLVVASHFGGSLTHGRDFLSWPEKKPSGNTPTTVDPTTLPVYAAAIQPVLDEYCVACHGTKKSKGKLRLDSFDQLLKGGESGEAIVRGDAEKSLLLKRMLLPVEMDEHMPPDGKPQPTAGEIELVRWWINSGASAEKSATELNAPALILQTLKR